MRASKQTLLSNCNTRTPNLTSVFFLKYTISESDTQTLPGVRFPSAFSDHDMSFAYLAHSYDLSCSLHYYSPLDHKPPLLLPSLRISSPLISRFSGRGNKTTTYTQDKLPRSRGTTSLIRHAFGSYISFLLGLWRASEQDIHNWDMGTYTAGSWKTGFGLFIFRVQVYISHLFSLCMYSVGSWDRNFKEDLPIG